MPIFYQRQPDDLPVAAPPPIGFDEDSDWWAGLGKCGAIAALAASLLASTVSATAQARQIFSFHQDEPAGSLYGQADEDLWENPTTPVPGSNQWPQPWAFDTQEPAGSLFGQPDEDLWQNQVPPVAGALRQFTPWEQEELPAGSLHGQPDEDYWQNPASPVAASLYQQLPYAFEQSETVPSTILQPDEDFWISWVPPVVASNFQRLPYLPDPDEISAGALQGQPDEDLWQNPVAPAPGINQWPQPWTFDTQDPAGSLFGQFDEDLWINLSQRSAWPNQGLYLFDSGELPVSAQRADEDFWQNPAPPAASGNRVPQPWNFDNSEFVAGAFAPDEDYWISGAARSPWSRMQPLCWPDSDEIPAAVVSFQPDEDCWTNAAVPALWPSRWPPQWAFEGHETFSGPLDWMVSSKGAAEQAMIATAGSSQQGTEPMEAIAGGVRYGLVAIAGGVNVVG